MSERVFDHGLKSDTIQRTKLKQWTRPSDWLPLPVLTENDKKFVGLHAVFPRSNFIALTAAGNYTVDWGDGVIENFSANVIAYHEYNYDTYDTGNATLCSRGYKQAIVSVYPQPGQTLTYLNLHRKHNKSSLSNYVSGFLDIAVASSDLTDLRIGSPSPSTGSATFNFSLVEQFNLVKSNCKRLNRLLLSMLSLANIVNFSVNDSPVIYATATTSSNFVQQVNHGRNNGDLITVYSTTGSPSVFAGNSYYVINATVDQFQLSSSFGGTSLTLGSGTINYCLGNTYQSTFAGCPSLKTIPFINLSNAVDCTNMFSSCRGLEVLPALDFSSAVVLTGVFIQCNSLRELTKFDIPSAVMMDSGFNSCYGLTKLPEINAPKLITLLKCFQNCYGLEKIVFTNLSSLFNFANAFENCSALSYFKSMSNPSITNIDYMFSNCLSLTECYLGFNTNLPSFVFTFQNCRSLAEAPYFNTANCTNIGSAFLNCSALTTLPLYDFSKVTSAVSTFSGCSNLKTVPLFNFALLTNATSMFSGCTSLETVPALNFGSVTSANFATIFSNCFNLSTFKATGVKYSISFAGCKLSSVALDEIYTNLGTGTGQTITVTNNHGTTSDNTSIATAKGWTVTG